MNTVEAIEKNELGVLSFKRTKELLDCSQNFIYKLISEGKINPRYIYKKPYFSIRELRDLLNE